MYLWNTKALAKELKEGTLSEREKFNYFFLNVVCYTVLVQIGIYTGYLYAIVTPLNLIISLISISITIIGTYLCFEANSYGDKVNFLERFFCLAIPVSIKIYVYSIPVLVFVTIILAVLKALFLKEISTESFSEFTSVVYIYLLEIVTYYYLYKYLKLVSGADSGNNNL